MAEKDVHLYMATMAEQAERYEDMVDAMKKVAKLGVGLTEEERDLLSVAYKHVIGTRRASWRMVSILEVKAKENDSAKMKTDVAKDKAHLSETETYRKVIENELRGICEDVLKILDENLIPTVHASSNGDKEENESYVFYYKMKGDYLRYLAEFTMGNDRKSAAEQSLLAYKSALDRAGATLQSTHPLRLGLALNFSIFYYEILNLPDRACKQAKQTLELAVPEIDSVPEEIYEDSAMIMQLLRDNLTLWTSDSNDDGANINGNKDQLNLVDAAD